MESFQQKVPPILLGAFEDIFDWKVEETTGSVPSIFLPLEKVVYYVTDLQKTSQDATHTCTHTGEGT
jgi:hypothetical protein